MDVLDYLYIDGEAPAPLKVIIPQTDTKTDVYGYYKSTSGAIISKDNDALAAYKQTKSKNSQINRMRNDITELKNDLEEIKNILKGLVK